MSSRTFADRLIPRSGWRARPARAKTAQDPADVRYLIAHYSAALADEQDLHRRCYERVRGIQNYHMDVHGWDDIGYSWVFCRHGSIFKGRGWRVVPAATLNHNHESVAACFLGGDNVDRDDVTIEGRAALREIWLFVQRNAPMHVDVRGHRDFNATRCPGDELYRFLALLR